MGINKDKEANAMKTKSIRARIDDAKEIERVSRELAVILERVVPVSEIVNQLMDYLEDAKKRIEEKNARISE